MSIFSKMTSIADKIRAIRGTTDTMGLDSMATNLETVQTNITSAFTAIGNKGGSVPSSRVSGNLVEAIQTIPIKSTPQVFTGSITARGTSFSEEINCGFQPDLVIVYPSDDYTEGGTSIYHNYMCAYLTDINVGEIYALRCNIGGMYDGLFEGCYIQKNTNSFSIGSFLQISMTGDFGYSTKTYQYKAIKY